MGRLGLDVLDLFLIHWPARARTATSRPGRRCASCATPGGSARSGVCNFHAPHLQRLFDETGEWPSINQVELHPYLQQAPLREFDAEHGIVTESWSPLASGKRVLDDPVIGRIAQDARRHPRPGRHRVAPGARLVVLPKSVTPSRIVENLAATDLVLTDDDLAAIAALDRGFRTGPNPDEFNQA